MDDHLTRVAEAVAAQVAAPDAQTVASAIRQRILSLPRFSFLSPAGGGVRRVPDRAGNWIEWDAAAALCELESVDAMLYAAPEAPQPVAPLGTPQNPICLAGEEMARLAEFAGISVDNREDAAGILLWVGEHRDDAGTAGYGLCASLEDYPEEGCYPLVELPRQQPADDAAALRSDIRAMASMLQAREWAEHFSADHDVTDLEVQITELVSMATALREQNATLVAALTPFALICKEGVVTKTEGHVAVTTCAEYFNRAEKVLAALASAEGGAA